MTVSQMLLQADGDASLLSRSNYLANLQVLIAELDASKDLNQKVGPRRIFPCFHNSGVI
jgi:hypothetical protein